MINRKLALVVHRDNLDKVSVTEKDMDLSVFGLMERTLCEKDTNYLQIIPYIVLQNDVTRKFFVYTRGEKGEENRLHGKCSIGLGGHIETIPDPEKYVSFRLFIVNDAFRELEEEVGIPKDDLFIYLNSFYIGETFLLSDETEVDKVHVGIPIILTLEDKELPKLEEGVITKGEWLTFDEIKQAVDSGEIELEKWSSLMMKDHLPVN
jgi:predicted NUDIX family phosphoesterase